jgi:hypothetical protein
VLCRELDLLHLVTNVNKDVNNIQLPGDQCSTLKYVVDLETDSESLVDDVEYEEHNLSDQHEHPANPQYSSPREIYKTRLSSSQEAVVLIIHRPLWGCSLKGGSHRASSLWCLKDLMSPQTDHGLRAPSIYLSPGRQTLLRPHFPSYDYLSKFER